MGHGRWVGLGLILALSWGCQRAEATGTSVSTAGSSAALSAAPSASAARHRGSAEPPASASAAVADPKPLEAKEFARLFRELSEPDRYFFSDNYVSNETSYLQVSADLEGKARKHAGYIGVGPEQNFTYIALTQPELAFIVDIRRGNALEHLLYKAIFGVASSRAEFLSLLIGREHQPKGAPGAEGSIGSVFAHVERIKPERKSFERIHRRMLDIIRDDLGVALSAADLKTLQDTHEAFFDAGLDLRFELHEKNGRRYPSLRDLLAAQDASSKSSGFLGSETLFRRVQKLQRAHRIIPVVGDFAGDHALLEIAKELRRRDLPVSVFYVSNVEQYLLEPDKWKSWMRNIDALPTNEQSLFVRCYLDQGRKHPLQLAGHRTATVLQSFDHFRWRARTRGYGSFYQLATDGALGDDAGADAAPTSDGGRAGAR